jgi:hypothetical protein
MTIVCHFVTEKEGLHLVKRSFWRKGPKSPYFKETKKVELAVFKP